MSTIASGTKCYGNTKEGYKLGRLRGDDITTGSEMMSTIMPGRGRRRLIRQWPANRSHECPGGARRGMHTGKV